MVTDQVGLSSAKTTTVIVDNTVPTAQITSPVDGDAVCGTLIVKGVATDANFASYTVRY